MKTIKRLILSIILWLWMFSPLIIMEFFIEGYTDTESVMIIGLIWLWGIINLAIGSYLSKRGNN